MNFISRLIARHKLFLLDFYPYLQKYLSPSTKRKFNKEFHPPLADVTYILAVLAQSCHDLVEPETLEPIVKLLADKFVSDRSSEEVITVG